MTAPAEADAPAVRMTPRRKEIAEKRKKALEMALAGASYDQIAKSCGWRNKSSAQRAVVAMMGEWAPLPEEDKEALRQQELARLDRLYQVHWINALRGDHRSTEQCLRITAMRAKITGMEAPTKIDATVRSGLDAEIQALLDKMPAPTKG